MSSIREFAKWYHDFLYYCYNIFFVFSSKVHSFVYGIPGISYICVLCVCFLPIHSGHQWTYQPGSHRRKVTKFIIHLLSAVHALIFLARRIQPFLSLVDREVEFCVLTVLIVLHPLGIFIFVF